MKRAASFHEDRYIMEPRDNSRRHEDEPSDGGATDRMLHDLGTPLAVVHGHVQLLQRRLRRGQVLHSDELLRTLSTMEQATRAITARLREHKDTPDDRDDDQEK
jgi:signal transduction histidine kinase